MNYTLNEEKEIIISCDNIEEFIKLYYDDEYEFLELKFEDENKYQELYDFVKDKPEYELLLSEFYAYGKIVEENNIKFFEIVSSLVEKKNKRAMFYMGIALMNGDGIDLDLKKGLKLLEKVADMGYSLADYQLCIYYANHYAISKVQKYKNKIKLNGSKKAKYMLAMSYYNVMNYADALTFMLSSAKAGYKPAYQRLALMYKNGLGTKKSQKDSEAWEAKAKESGCYFTNIEKDED